MSDAPAFLRQQILRDVAVYQGLAHVSEPFRPGIDTVHYAGRVFGAEEIVSLVSSALDFTLTAGPYAVRLERALRQYFGVNRFCLVNSGSSANLLMVSALCARGCPIRATDGDEVITPAATFPTTLAPILQNRLIPVFVDCAVNTLNADYAQVEAAIGPRTRAIFIPHTLGSPHNVTKLRELADRHGIWFLEDGCDALGATYNGQLIGSFGHMSSVSFYPAHHMTTGEGGGVAINDSRFSKIVPSLRDWGRDCWCMPGASDTCGKRYEQDHGDLPHGYDHKYVYSEIGYNLKMTDLQAAVGIAQLARLPSFITQRRFNYDYYRTALGDLAEHVEFASVDPAAEPSWFGFPLILRDHVDRVDLLRYLAGSRIETRLLFAGNILRQPGYADIPHRLVAPLTETDRLMRQALFIGVYPGLTAGMRDYVVERLLKYFRRR